MRDVAVFLDRAIGLALITHEWQHKAAATKSSSAYEKGDYGTQKFGRCCDCDSP